MHFCFWKRCILTLDNRICEPHVFFDSGRFLSSLVSSYGQEYVNTAYVLYSRLDVPRSIRRDLYRRYFGALLGKAVLKKHFYEKRGLLNGCGAFIKF